MRVITPVWHMCFNQRLCNFVVKFFQASSERLFCISAFRTQLHGSRPRSTPSEKRQIEAAFCGWVCKLNSQSPSEFQVVLLYSPKLKDVKGNPRRQAAKKMPNREWEVITENARQAAEVNLNIRKSLEMEPARSKGRMSICVDIRFTYTLKEQNLHFSAQQAKSKKRSGLQTRS